MTIFCEKMMTRRDALKALGILSATGIPAATYVFVTASNASIKIGGYHIIERFTNLFFVF